MSGDIGLEERAVVLTSKSEADTNRVASEMRKLGGRVTLHYGPGVVIGEVTNGNEYALREALPGALVVERITEVPQEILDSLDPDSLLGLEAFEMRQSEEYAKIKAGRPYDGQPWDVARSPDGTDKTRLRRRQAGGITGVDTMNAARLSGRVVVGIIFVSGPTPDLQFDSKKRAQVSAEVQNGLSWLGTQNGNPAISWFIDVRRPSITVPPNPSAPDREALWMDPAMKAMGFSANADGVRDYLQQIRGQYLTDWTFCGFFVNNYPLAGNDFAYAYPDEYVVMQYSNGSYGPDNIDRVFAHEACHIFDAEDEYKSSKCNCTNVFGYFDVVNGNCTTCAPNGGVSCLMNKSAWEMCDYTRWQVGYTGSFPALYFQGAPGSGIGTYPLDNPADRIFAFDYDLKGTADHLVCYRPGEGRFTILFNQKGSFGIEFDNTPNGIAFGGTLKTATDRLFALDFGGPAIVRYQPGDGGFSIFQRNKGALDFSRVFAAGGKGIAQYPLDDPNDRALAFDYDSSGLLDHVVLYRPGTGQPGTGKITIAASSNSGKFFTPVFEGQNGKIGNYSLDGPGDRIIAYDFDSSGRRDHLLLYRPGTGNIQIVKRNGQDFDTVFESDGDGISIYDLMNGNDRIMAYDFNSTGNLDHLILYRPGQGNIVILRHLIKQTFEVLFNSGTGIASYDLGSTLDRGFVFDFVGKGGLNTFGFYRPGSGAIQIVNNAPENAAQPT